MAQPAFQFEQLSIMPPSFDLAKALELAKDVHELRAALDRAERETIAWKASTSVALRTAFESVEKAAEAMPTEAADAAMVQFIDENIGLVDNEIADAARPLNELNDWPNFHELMSGHGPASRFFRKSVSRIEEIRRQRLNALIDARYSLMAFRADHDPDARSGMTFGNADDMDAYLKGLVA